MIFLLYYPISVHSAIKPSSDGRCCLETSRSCYTFVSCVYFFQSTFLPVPSLVMGYHWQMVRPGYLGMYGLLMGYFTNASRSIVGTEVPFSPPDVEPRKTQVKVFLLGA